MRPRPKGAYNHGGSQRAVNRAAQPWTEQVLSHQAPSCEKPLTPEVEKLLKEIERREEETADQLKRGPKGPRRKRGGQVKYDPVEDAKCASCGKQALDGRILCEKCHGARTMLDNSCSVPGCTEQRRVVYGRSLRYCATHMKRQQRRYFRKQQEKGKV